MRMVVVVVVMSETAGSWQAYLATALYVGSVATVGFVARLRRSLLLSLYLL